MLSGVKRVALVGAESTGKTMLAEALAKHYQTHWVPEFFRFYWEARRHHEKAVDWKTEDFVFMASQQNALEDELARSCNRILFCDTDSFSTSIWHERYLGTVSSEVGQLSLDRSYSLYFLTDVNTPFIQDGTRDGEKIRDWMFGRFKVELERRGKPYLFLSGDFETRLRAAIVACDRLLAENDKIRVP